MRSIPCGNVSVKRAAVRAELHDLGSVVVALSGGVDSAVLLGLALEVLGGDRVLAVTADSPSLARDDLDAAREVARQTGARHEVVSTRELERPGYRANAGDRCFHCRTELFEVLSGVARREGMRSIVYGAIQEDENDHRPGMRAAEAAGVLAPLKSAGLTKQEVRDLAAELGLAVRDKPQGACLASRIPTGVEVTADRLARIERAESGLRALGFRQLRVRHHGDVARLELDRDSESLLARPGMRQRVVAAVRAAGYRFVALDLEGYRPGSLNPVAPNRAGGQ